MIYSKNKAFLNLESYAIVTACIQQNTESDNFIYNSYAK